MSKIVLKGMTWNHTRGYAPLEATARAFSDQNPDVQIIWDRRSLKEFEDYPITQLAANYDLIVFDHPFVGYAASNGPLLPLDQVLPASFLADQAIHSVGASHASYEYGGHHWALAIDSAAPVACWRDDLLAKHGLRVPSSWDDLLELARGGHVEVPAAPINCLMTFFALCLAHGETPFGSTDKVVSTEVGRGALKSLRTLLSLCNDSVWSRNPINSMDLLASSANPRVAYCLFPYGYSNYARHGYAENIVTFGDLPTLHGAPLRSVLGGTGLGVSALRQNREMAARYAQFTATPEIQRGLYTLAGGQPGYRSAWLDEMNNQASGNYFKRTLPVLDRAWLRPRYSGYIEFQEKAGPVIHDALRGALPEAEALVQIDSLYRTSLTVPLHT